MPIKDMARRILPKAVFDAVKAAKHFRYFGTLDRNDVFQKIYDQNLWGNPESLSGNGSTLASTATLRAELAAWLAKKAVQSFVDIPCGDFNWMQHVNFPDGMSYTGLDVVPALVEKMNARYGNAQRAFAHADILVSDLPAADVYFCKDLFIHFPNDAIATAIARVLPRCRYFLSTTFAGVTENENIRFGGARKVTLEPLLGPPLAMLRDFGDETADRFIGVWQGKL